MTVYKLLINLIYEHYCLHQPAAAESTVNWAFLLTKALVRPGPLDVHLEPSEWNLGREFTRSASVFFSVSIIHWADCNAPGLPEPKATISLQHNFSLYVY